MRRLVRAAPCLAVALYAVSLGVAGAQSDPAARVYVEGAAFQAGSTGASDVLLILGAEGPVTSLEVILEYDGAVLATPEFVADSAWAPTGARAAVPGRLEFAVTSPGGCVARSSCRVGELRWQALRNGDATVRVVSVVAAGATGRVQLGTSESRVSVFAAAAGDDGLGLTNGLAVIILVGLASVAVSAPLAMGVRRIARGRRPTAVPAPPGAGEAMFDDLAQAASGYLDAYELAGRANDAPDVVYDGMARQAAGPNELAAED